MARDISVSISVQGAKEFDQALRDAQSAVKVLSSELKASEAAFDENADAQAFYANKMRLINEQIDQQKIIFERLKKAVEEAGKEFGESSAKTDKYRIELNRTEASIAKLERSLRKTQQEAEELGRDSTRIGRQLEQGIGEAADDVSDKLDKMAKQIESDLSDIGGAVEFSAIMDAGDALKAAGDALTSFTEDTEDYRRQMSFLEQNVADSGFDFEYIKEQLFGIASLTGDADGAFEAISNLLATGFDGKELEEAIDLISGAVVRFPETMKFENLAESLQESVAAGSATGAYAELLERLGVDLETVNKALEEAETLEGRQQAALAFLNEHGLEETAQNYKDMNADLIDNEKAQLKYNDALAGLGEKLIPVTTAWTNFRTEFAKGATDLIDGGFDTWLENQGKALEDFREEMNRWMEDLIGEENYQKIFGGEREAGTPGEYAGLVQLQEQQGANYGSAYGAAAQGAVVEAIESAGESAQKAGEEAGESAMTGVVDGMEKQLETAIENSETVGSNIAVSIGNGITDSSESAINAATTMWNGINSILTQQITIPAPRFGAETYDGVSQPTATSYAAGGQNTVTVVTKIDSNTVAKTVAGGVGSELGSQAQRASTYNR